MDVRIDDRKAELGHGGEDASLDRALVHFSSWRYRRGVRALYRLILALGLLGFVACSDPSDPGIDAGPEVEAGGGGTAGGQPAVDADVPLEDAAIVRDAEPADSGEPPFARPDGGSDYTPEPGTCGFDAPAFCDTFELGPAQASGRSGELDLARWSGMRGGPWSPPSLEDGYAVGPARLPECRADLPATVPADRDALICDPIAAIPTRHALITAAAQNYGLTTYRIRQPFDFAGRTGTIKLDAELVNNGLGGWPAIVVSEDPSPAPSFDWEERGSGPRNGFEIELNGGWCNTPNTLEVGLYTFRDYEQTSHRPSFDCETPHTTTARDQLNHVEIYVSSDRLEVWASEPSADGRTFDNFQLLLEQELDLPFTRGYVSLVVRNHATLKYWLGSAAHQRFDNVGFDGPVIEGWREHSAPDSLTVKEGLDGCMVDGACAWRGDVIVDHPGDDTVCHPEASCTYPGQARYVGYVVPRSDEPEPVAIPIPGVDLSGATRARLALAGTYPWFEWSEMFPPPITINLRYRVNGGPWHDRFVNDVEEMAFTDFSPELGGAGAGSGLLNQIIELDLAELHDGDNTIELYSDGTWTGAYRVGVVALDLILDTAP
jgi:hypothetical protein